MSSSLHSTAWSNSTIFIRTLYFDSLS